MSFLKLVYNVYIYDFCALERKTLGQKTKYLI